MEEPAVNGLYAYDPALQDMFLYEDVTLSYSVPSAGTIAAKQIIGWNPQSWVYPYRKSLQGFGLSYRQYTPSWGPRSPNWNDPAFNALTPYATYPQFYHNMYAVQMFSMGAKYLYTCSHVYDCTPTTVRNPANRWLPNYMPPNTEQTTLLRWRFVSHDDQVTEVNAEDLLPPYVGDPEYPALKLGPALSNLTPDVCMTETQANHGIPSVLWGNATNIGFNAKAFILSNTGIVHRSVVTTSFVQSQSLVSVIAGRKPDNTPVFWYLWLYDSGTTVWVEVKPPTSAEAGDGVLAMLTGQVVGNGSIAPYSNPYDGPFAIGGNAYDYSTYGAIANDNPVFNNYWSEYMQWRGHTVPDIVAARRQPDIPIATLTMQNQIESAVNQIAERFQ